MVQQRKSFSGTVKFHINCLIYCSNIVVHDGLRADVVLPVVPFQVVPTVLILFLRTEKRGVPGFQRYELKCVKRIAGCLSRNVCVNRGVGSNGSVIFVTRPQLNSALEYLAHCP